MRKKSKAKKDLKGNNIKTKLVVKSKRINLVPEKPSIDLFREHYTGVFGNSGTKLNYKTGEQCIEVNESFADYAHFPAISYFTKKFGCFPSEHSFSAYAEVNKFETSEKNIKKDFEFRKTIASRDNDANFLESKCVTFFTIHKKRIAVFLNYYNDANVFRMDLRGADGLTQTHKNHRHVNITVFYDLNDYDNITIQKEIIEKYFDIELFKNVPPPKAISLIIENKMQGLHLKPIQLPKPEIDFDLHYESVFKSKHDFIIEQLTSKEVKSGLVILHGVPGAGKTMYLRYLVNEVQDKNIIWVPSNMIPILSTPSFLSFMLDYKDSILVLEEAELALVNEGDVRNMAVANLLNICDGILSDALNIKVIATFNTELKNIDQALLREGRLILKHEFKALPAEQATKLSAKLGINKIYTEPKTLAQIYNEEKEFKEPQKTSGKIGF